MSGKSQMWAPISETLFSRRHAKKYVQQQHGWDTCKSIPNTYKVFGRVAGVGTYSAIKHVAEVINLSGIEQVFSYSLSFLFGWYPEYLIHSLQNHAGLWKMRDFRGIFGIFMGFVNGETLCLRRKKSLSPHLNLFTVWSDLRVGDLWAFLSQNNGGFHSIVGFIRFARKAVEVAAEEGLFSISGASCLCCNSSSH